MGTVLEIRQALADRGYTPIPCKKKIPPFVGWQTIETVTSEMLRNWGKNWPSANNTGLLTKRTPALDIDIRNELAAVAIEDMVRDRFEEGGAILVRIGRAPKRAILFRTTNPFAKIDVSLIDAKGGTEDKIEFLCDGQQVVVAGIHPETLKPYVWPLGNPTDIARADLPDINEAEAKQLVEDIVELLCKDFGYSRRAKAKRPSSKATNSGNGAQVNLASDWQDLIDQILAGHALHDSTRNLGAKLIRAGMAGGAAVNFLRALMDRSAAPRDERFENRYNDIVRLVDGFEAKLEHEREKAAAVAAAVADLARNQAAAAAAAPAPAQAAAATSPASTAVAIITPGAWGGPPPPPPPPPRSRPAASAAPGPSTPPIEDTLQTFERWLELPNRTPVYALLGTISANLLDGDPVWTGIVAPPSSAKTELLNAVSRLPFVVSVSTLTLASLLSGTPRRQLATGATGGLLRHVSNPGVLCLKDFTSTLTMRPDGKAEVLSALREIYDGKWVRYVGTDGGRALHWAGKLGLVFGCTGAIDTQHSVSDALGNRFLLSRLEPGEGQLRWALKHVGVKTAEMRHELAEAVNTLFDAPRRDPQELSEDEIVRFERMTNLVVRLRGAVERDRFRRELDAVYGAEGPARVGLSLERLLAGLDVLGVDRKVAMDVVISVGLDSTPPLRRSVYRYLCGGLDPLKPPAASVGPLAARSTAEVAHAMGLPTNTVRRALEELTSYGLVNSSHYAQGMSTLWQAILLP